MTRERGRPARTVCHVAALKGGARKRGPRHRAPRRPSHPHRHPPSLSLHRALASFFAPASFATFSFASAQQFDRAGLIGRALSSSYVPNAGQPGHAAFLTRLNALFDKHAESGRVSFDYACKLHLGRLNQ